LIGSLALQRAEQRPAGPSPLYFAPPAYLFHFNTNVVQVSAIVKMAQKLSVGRVTRAKDAIQRMTKPSDEKGEANPAPDDPEERPRTRERVTINDPNTENNAPPSIRVFSGDSEPGVAPLLPISHVTERRHKLQLPKHF
jgi:hypothetical protein